MNKKINRFAMTVLALVMLFVLLPTSPTIVSASDMVYLESDIFSSAHSSMARYPANGSFSMGGTTYYRGIVSETFGGSITYDITGKGFTRLTGTFGRTSNNAGTITITGDGAFLGGYEISSTGMPIPIDVAIPAGTSQVVIRIDDRSGLGLGDAFFSGGAATQQPTQPTPTGGSSYIESDIFSSAHSSMARYPANGSFSMGGTTYYRGIVSEIFGGSITYDITGKGFTRLTGTFGRTGNNAGTITITGDGTFLGGYEVSSTGMPIPIDVAIPAGTSQIVIRIDDRSGLGLGDAYFSGGTATQQPQEPSAIPNPHSSWAAEELERAFDEKLVPPLLRDPIVDLREPVTRVEFAGIVVLTYQNISGTTLPIPSGNAFTDTTDIYARIAYDAGLMVGVSTNTFDPDTILNREQAATALTRVFKRWHIPGWTLANDRDGLLTFEWPAPFADDAIISNWARESVYFMYANDIIGGIGNNSFAPRAVAENPSGYANATREQALIIALRMVEEMR